MTGLILLSIALIALVGALCTLLYTQQLRTQKQIRLQHEMLVNLDRAFLGLSDTQQAMNKRIDQLATDVLQREIYKSADDRHQLAIQSAKQGRSVVEIIQRHGLSSDEAALIVSLHTPKPATEEPKVKNANFIDSASAELV